MKLYKLTLILIFFITRICTIVYGQCEETYVKEHIPQISNEPEFSFDDNTIISVSENAKIKLTFDTSYLKYDSINPKILNNKNYEFYSNEETNIKNYFIKNISSNRSNFIGSGQLEYSIALKNCFICIFYGLNGKSKISVFDYAKSIISFYDLNVREPIGYNDSCIYLVPGDFKIKNKKFRRGTIISLNENGIQIIKPIFKKYSSYDYNSVFYSNTFKVTKSFLYRDNKICNIEDHLMIKIRYLDQIVDSFEVIQTYYSNPIIEVKGDTLICQSGENFRNISYNETYKKYFKTNFIGEWKKSIWLDSFPAIKDNYTDYYNKGDLLFLKIKCNSNNSSGLKYIDEKLFTLNDIGLKTESTYYNLVLAFNIRTNRFLGYPKIEFISK